MDDKQVPPEQTKRLVLTVDIYMDVPQSASDAELETATLRIPLDQIEADIIDADVDERKAIPDARVIGYSTMCVVIDNEEFTHHE